MGKIKVEIRPFDINGDLVSDYIDVTNDVANIGTISNKIERDDYEIGIFTIDNIKITLRNKDGTYSDVDNTSSLFDFKRDGARLRVQWSNDDVPVFGGAVFGANSFIQTLNVFEGVLNARSNTQNIVDQNVSFDVVSYDYLLTQYEKPYYGDLLKHNIEDVVFDWLDSTVGTNGDSIITIDKTNWEFGTGNTYQFADIDEELTLKEALDDVIFKTNSVLYIKDETLFIKPRRVSETIKYTFNGPSVVGARENINNIDTIRDGENKIFNSFVWEETNLISQDITSVNTYGVRQKEVTSNFFTSNTDKQEVLDNLKDEYRNPKKELRVKVPLDVDTADLFLMDSVTIDYPASYAPSVGDGDPYWDKFNWDESFWPISEFDLIIQTSTEWKIIGIQSDIKNEIVTFNLREI